MSRPGKQAAAARLAVAVQLVGSVCALLLAVCLALSFTLLREGHFAACLKKSGYLDTVHAAVLDTCSQYAAAIGTTADPLANAITPDAVYAGVMHRADSLWHGSTNDETDPFGSLITTYQDTVAPEPPTYDGYRILQYNCQMEWQSAMGNAVFGGAEYGTAIPGHCGHCHVSLRPVAYGLHCIAISVGRPVAYVLRWAAAYGGWLPGSRCHTGAVADPWQRISQLDCGRGYRLYIVLSVVRRIRPGGGRLCGSGISCAGAVGSMGLRPVPPCEICLMPSCILHKTVL